MRSIFKLNNRLIIFILAITIMMGTFSMSPIDSNARTHNDTSDGYHGEYGSVGYIDGKTLIVSIFVSDTKTTWKKTNTDMNEMLKVLNKLKIAVEYIKSECLSYGVKTDMLYDWTEYPDLVYTPTVNYDVDATPRRYNHLRTTVMNTVDQEALKKKYDADNVLYLMILNTDGTNKYHNNTFSHYFTSNVSAEIVTLHKKTNYSDNYPATYLLPSSVAHEILHAFGAPDLYVANNAINQTYVNHVTQKQVNDIMRTTNYGDSIKAKILSTSAYYLGLTSSAPDVKKFNLKKSEKDN